MMFPQRSLKTLLYVGGEWPHTKWRLELRSEFWRVCWRRSSITLAQLPTLFVQIGIFAFTRWWTTDAGPECQHCRHRASQVAELHRIQQMYDLRR